MKRNVLTQYLIITASCALYAVGFNWMFDPNHISVGGFTGLGQIINYLLPGLPIGTIVIILNVPLFVLGWRFIGKDFLFSSFFLTAGSAVPRPGPPAAGERRYRGCCGPDSGGDSRYRTPPACRLAAAGIWASGS